MNPIGTSASLMTVRWLGHATALISVDDVRVLTDPVLRPRIGPLVRTARPADPAPLGRVDAILLSHLHADHTDLPSLRRIGGSVPIVAPEPAASWLRRAGVSRVQEVRAGGETSIQGLRVIATEARHDARRRPFGPAAEPVGYLVRGSRSAYFAGDTDLFDGMADLGEALDVALLPVWGWGPSVGAGHLDPDRAAHAAQLIRPRAAIPIHWGTFARGRPWRRPADPAWPARRFAALVADQAPTVAVHVLAPGEQIEVG